MLAPRLALVAGLALAGCSPDTALAPDAAVVIVTPEDGAFDLRFQPASLQLGEAISVDSERTRMASLKTESGHRVELQAPGHSIQRVVGLLDGQPQVSIGEGSGDGGLVSRSPTSVHERTICTVGVCSVQKEFDYDLHDPSGEGTAEWRTPDGRSATIDRLRFELSATPERAARTAVASPHPLVLAR